MRTNLNKSMILIAAVVVILGATPQKLPAQINPYQAAFMRAAYTRAAYMNAVLTHAQYVNNLIALAELQQQYATLVYFATTPTRMTLEGNVPNIYSLWDNLYVAQAAALTNAALTNPYTPAPWNGAYGGYSYMPYTFIPPAGYFLMGTASVIEAYPNVIKGNEEARILREKWRISHLETLKKRAETELYLKRITPTWSEKEAKTAQKTLKRIQFTSGLSEIWSGKALNILLDDLRKTRGAKFDANEGTIPEEILSHINIAAKFGNLGLLRHEGRFVWPNALTDLLSSTERMEIESKAQLAMQNAVHGRILADVLQNLETILERTQQRLTDKVNDIPTKDYMESKRFLQEFNDARVAMKDGDAPHCFEFQKWCRGGKTVQQVVAYMAERGLRFAPAVPGDEDAYQAMHSFLATYDIEYHARATGGSRR
jgi:hypothetical protein